MERFEKAELLAPSGNFDCVIAAVNAGADAVYLGGRSFGARAYAANFDNDELEKACDLCHSFGVRLYVTVNTLYRDEEFPELLSFIDALYAMGVDGLIMQDLGAIRMVRHYWPDLHVHASTQLTANSADDVLAFEQMGLTTAVLSRELNLKEIKDIADRTNIRIETFIHGALCVSYSGQCLMSSVLGNRSGNRGKCAQNCRLCYDLMRGKEIAASGHLLSTKDICTLPLLPKLLETGVASLKIEGRMKSPEYVAGVTGIYRKYLDLYYSGKEYAVDPQDILTLQQLFNRGAFSEGYLQTHSGMVMMCPAHPKHWGVYAGKVLSFDRKKQLAAIRFNKDMIPGDGIEIRTDDENGVGGYLNKAAAAGQKTIVPVKGDIRPDLDVYQTWDKRLMDELKQRYQSLTRKVPVSAYISLHAGMPAELTFRAGAFSAAVHGDVPVPAQNQPLTRDLVSQQIGRLGNTIFEMREFRADMEEGLYLNRSSLNDLKNNAAELLKEKMISSRKHRPVDPRFDALPAENEPSEKTLTVLVRTPEQFACAAACPAVSVIFLEMTDPLMDGLDSFVSEAHRQNKKAAVMLPRIFRSYIRKNAEEYLERCLHSGTDGFLISNIGHYHAVKDSGKKIFLDLTANVFNSYTYDFWKRAGAESIALSVEMSRDEINGMADLSKAELLAYGYIPLMVTHQCPVGNFAGKKTNQMHCQKYGCREDYTLRSGKDNFRLETDCKNCICTITTSDPLDIREDVNSFRVNTIRLNFTDENKAETAEILRIYRTILSSGKSSAQQKTNIYDKRVL